MPSNKVDLPRNPVNLSDESRLYDSLRLKNTPLTTSGAFSVTSASSGVTYSTTTGGEQDVLNQLNTAIGTSIITASDINEIGDLTTLTTTNKTSLVNASNEINAKVNTNGKYNAVTIETRNLNVNTGGSFIKSDFNNVKINVATAVASGTQITVEIDDDGTTYNLYSDYAGTESVTELAQGVYDIVFRDSATDFFYLAPSGGGTIASVQYGEFLYPSANTTFDVTINAVNTDNTIIYVHGSGGGANGSLQCFRAELINSTTIRITRNATGLALTVSYQVVEYEQVKSKQTGTVSSTAFTINETLTSINASKSICFVTFRTNGGAQTQCAFLINSNTNLKINFNDSGTKDIAWQVLEFV